MGRRPWEWLYDVQSQPLKAYVLDEVAKHLATAAEEFPPDIEGWERDDLRARFEPLFARVRGRPSTAVLACALKLYRWELERDVEQIDRYMAGEHWREYALGPDELETAIFLWHYWTDQSLAFKEFAQGKFTHRELLGLADRLDARLVAQAAALRSDPRRPTSLN